MRYELKKKGETLYLGAFYGRKCEVVLGLYEDPEEGPYMALTPAELRKLAEKAILLAVELERANGKT